MNEILIPISLGLLVTAIVLLLVVLQRQSRLDLSGLLLRLDNVDKAGERVERGVKDEISRNREEASREARGLREEVGTSLTRLADSNDQKLEAVRVTLEQQFKTLLHDNAQRLERIREDALVHARANEAKVEQLRLAVEAKLTQIQQDNAARLEEMRRTVDEKLQGALEKRLGESFRLVSDRLEQVHKGLGEMQTLASGVGDLKKVLTNVKTRGTWGEVQLGNLLEQILTVDQFERNVCTKQGSPDRVEFAIKLPGREEAEGKVVWLPIDAKFPKEDYERLVEAGERADITALEEAAKQLELRIKAEARNIRDKYIDPPHTTDFGILFLPTEGLYAEALRRPGVMDILQRDYRVMVAGPTTLAALLNSLQMGFRTLAIEKRSSEVWAVLAAVKTEFGKFGEVIDKVQRKLQEASHVIDSAATRSRVIERKLREVEEIPGAEATALLEAAEPVPRDAGELPLN